MFTLQGKTEDFPQNDEIPASIYGDTHGHKELGTQRLGRFFWSRTLAHSHALAYAHWDRRGFYKVVAYTGPADFGWFPIVKKRRDEHSDYFRGGCREIANIYNYYNLISPEDVQWIASYRIWDQTGAKIGLVNRQGLGYLFDDHTAGYTNIPEGDTGDADGSGTVRLVSSTEADITPGATYEVNITTDVPYYLIVLCITSPGETEPDTIAGSVNGDGTKTKATISYTFPTDSPPGKYEITAIVFLENLNMVTKSHDVMLINNVINTPDQDETTTYIADSSTRTLAPASGSNTYATVGSTHESSLTSSVPYESVIWQVEPPNHTGNTIPVAETDTGDGTATLASLSYTFPTGVTGTYTIMANVQYSDTSSRQLSYDVRVTLSPGLRPINGSSYYANSGDTYEMGLVTNGPYSEVRWSVSPRGDTSTEGAVVETDTATDTTTEAEFSYTLPTGTPGYCRITAHIFLSGSTDYKVTYDVYVY